MKEKGHQGEHGAVYHFGTYPPMDNTMCANTLMHILLIHANHLGIPICNKRYSDKM